MNLASSNSNYRALILNQAGFAIVEMIAADLNASGAGGAGKHGRPGLDALLDKRGVQVVKFTDWKKIEEAETARAREGAPREKFVTVEDMIKASG